VYFLILALVTADLKSNFESYVFSLRYELFVRYLKVSWVNHAPLDMSSKLSLDHVYTFGLMRRQFLATS
jgi:hypothetical protein